MIPIQLNKNTFEPHIKDIRKKNFLMMAKILKDSSRGYRKAVTKLWETDSHTEAEWLFSMIKKYKKINREAKLFIQEQEHQVLEGLKLEWSIP